MESSVPGCLAAWETHGFHTLGDLDIPKIKEEAGARWLRPNEIYAILCNYIYFNINVKPVDLPMGGTIFLFDRKKLRNFRKDGHNWKKKKDGKTVKEAHEHLKVGDLDRIHVYYAHGEDNPNFVRRIYWLLDKTYEHIVLVHYRETLEESGNQPPSIPKECKEALSFSNWSNIPSPFTPVLSSPSSASRVLSEDTDSGLEGSSTSVLVDPTEVGNENLLVRDHEQRLYEINTLDWDELVNGYPSTDIPVTTGGVASLSIQQIGNEPRQFRSNQESLPGSHSSGTDTDSSILNNQTGNQPLSMTTELSFQESDSKAGINGINSMPDALDKKIFHSHDSFGKWMNTTYLNHASSLLADDLLASEHELGLHTSADQALVQQQIFTITDVSPGWAFSTEETKVLVVGYFHEARAGLANANLFCVFGDKSVPVEMVQAGVFRCTTLPCAPGAVNLYLTLDGFTPISQILNFEYRSNLTNDAKAMLATPISGLSQWEEFQLQSRLAHLLFSTINSAAVLSGKISSSALREAKKFLASTPSYEKDWANLMRAVGNNEIQISEANRNLFELSLKIKLREWLFEKMLEGCRTTGLDSMGQGVLHLCAILGYSWAVYLFSRSGLSIDFRDAHGWTALHWAAYCGREHMVAFLLSAGANPSLVTDPTAESPGGCTAADLASVKGYDGLAAYLAEKGLTAHFEAMEISGNISGSLPANEYVPVKPDNVYDDELCVRDSLAAYRTAAEAAARIQAAFREQTLKLKTKAALEKTEAEATHIVAALKIQHAFRNYHSKKRMAAAAHIQYRFRAWKIRRDFLNLRRQTIKIQAAFRGHLMRRQYKKIVWSVGILEKAVLRWRLKRKGLRGLQVEPMETAGEMQAQSSGVEDFYQISQKHATERVARSVVKVQAMFRSHQAQKEYRRMKLAFDQAKLEYQELLDGS